MYQACLAHQRIAISPKHVDEVTCLRFGYSGFLGQAHCQPITIRPAGVVFVFAHGLSPVPGFKLQTQRRAAQFVPAILTDLRLWKRALRTPCSGPRLWGWLQPCEAGRFRCVHHQTQVGNRTKLCYGLLASPSGRSETVQSAAK